MGRFRVVCLASPTTPIRALDIERAILDRVGAAVELAVAGTEEATIAAVQDADGILHRGGRLTGRVIRGLERCRIVAHGGVGYDTIDVEAATATGIVVTNVADYCIDEVSDHALLFLLALSRRLRPLADQVRGGSWQPRQAGPVWRSRGQTAAVVGYGRIGSAFGRKVQVLGIRVLAVDPFVDPADLVAQGAVPSTLEEALPQADVVSVHTPLTDLTRHMFGTAQFRRMKSTAYFLNTARGGVVDEPALLRAITEGWIAGAALDVLEQEPPDPTNPLLHSENVIVTPHAAYYSEASVQQVRRTMAEQVASVLVSQRPAFVVNPEVYAVQPGRMRDTSIAR